ALAILATLPPEPPVLRLRLETLDRLGRTAEADALLEAQLAAAPGAGVVVALDMDRLARRGAERETAALERGLADLHKAPDREASATVAAGWLLAWGRAPLAARLLDAVGLPDQPSPQQLRARASVLHAAGRTGEAEAAYRRSLELAPNDAGTLNDLGYLLASQRRSLNEAVGLLRRAIEQEPDEPAFLDSLGWALYQSGQPQEALVWLQKAVRRAGERDEPEIREHLGDVYFALGQTDRAMAEWQAALVLGGEDRPDLRRKIDETRAASNRR
ncbi:MAG: tetratricopeptide repeat protein, partial [Acidobacteria bacterium]|nr:tetratricopeptide repeat protein [Acidobacteriota bacterium]